MDLSNIKIVFVDIDGTLVTTTKEITEKTKNSIKRVVDKGIKVVLVSGRDVVHTVAFSKNSNSSGIVISCGGARIYDYENNINILEDYFSYDKVLALWNYSIDNEVGLILKSNTAVYHNKYSLVTNGIKYKPIDTIKDITDFHVSQFLLMSNDHKKIDNVYKYVIGKGMYVTSLSLSYFENRVSNYYGIDVNNSDVSKGTAIKKLLKYLGIKKEESICFGDYINDIEMFKESGFKVAMGNSIQEIKDMADFVTKSNDEDGLSYFLDTYL